MGAVLAKTMDGQAALSRLYRHWTEIRMSSPKTEWGLSGPRDRED